MKEFLKKAGTIIDKVLTVICEVTFSIIFLTFMTTIVSRYLLKMPVTWSYEVSVLAYMWTMFFGVGLGIKNDEHVVFGLVYDKRSERGQAMYLIIYNVILVVLLLISFIPGLNSLLSSTMITGVLKLPYKLIFAPYFFMLIDIIVRSGINLKHAIIRFQNAPKVKKGEAAK